MKVFGSTLPRPARRDRHYAHQVTTISSSGDPAVVEPDAWQADVLRAFPTHQRLAMKAAKGPGKTTVLAWMILNFLATRAHSNVAATLQMGVTRPPIVV